MSVFVPFLRNAALRRFELSGVDPIKAGERFRRPNSEPAHWCSLRQGAGSDGRSTAIFLSPQIRDVHVRSEPDIIGEVPSYVIRVVIDDDIVAIPVPVAAIPHIESCNAEIESPKPEAARTTADQMPDMAPANSAREMAVFPGMVEVKAGIVGPVVMADPLSVVVDVGRFRMTLYVFGRRRRPTVARRRTMLRNVPAPDRMAATMLSVLRPDWQDNNE